ncbi:MULTISPECIES: molybdenum cofactor guanylyltransferase [unclassified Microbacterium]|uniref:molybdenum cofactor guanylyltransferase n=1 Tax=unclassified Microbacterium TaxID=2609290 RepID=UPI00214CC5F4|nr:MULTISPECIES: molybdenum cofactor guanylyltransferase [unclassified Microbacterium]MCR2810335.1 molybdenum cofactor guanylyltransferase [Microbacterium sp. zg.B185]WIM18394.1 molybdenum cofactor guanylyltransferase [Microbacterium sp. zg-B185]
MNEFAGILLAGGRGSRMGGVHKPLLEVGGRTLLDAAVTAAHAAGCDPIIAVGAPVVSTQAPIAPVTWVREDPPFGGPVAAILAALPLISAPHTLILACDVPRVGAAVALLRAAQFDADGACLIDESGRRQLLAGVYRTDALRAAGATLPGHGHGASVRALLEGLQVTEVSASDDITADIDTWDDLHEARRRNP